MKEKVLFLFLIVFFILFVACSDKYFIEDELIVPENPYEIPLETAVEKALDFMDQMYPETRSKLSRAKVDATTLYRTAYPQTRGESTTEIPLHVIHFLTETEEPAGFVVMVGDERIEVPIVVFSNEKTTWDLSDVPVFEEIFFCAVDQLIAESVEKYDPVSDISTRTDPNVDCMDGNISYHDELLHEIPHCTAWDQGPDPYNRYMPACAIDGSDGRMLAGCSTIALAQIFAHFEYPISNAGRAWRYDLLTSDYVVVGSYEEIGLFVKYVGDMIGVTYGCLGSSASSAQVYNTLNAIGYNRGTVREFNLSDVHQSLKQGQLVHMRGTPILNTNVGHAWVVEGVRRVMNREEYWDICAPNFNPVLVGEFYSETNYQYYNLGNGGDGNGWYRIQYNYVVPGEYPYNVKIIPFIEPK